MFENTYMIIFYCFVRHAAEIKYRKDLCDSKILNAVLNILALIWETFTKTSFVMIVFKIWDGL